MCGHSHGLEFDPIACVVPPFVLEKLAESTNAMVRKAALRNLQVSVEFRSHRATVAAFSPGIAAGIPALPTGPAKLRREVYDQGKKNPPNFGLPGTLRRAEGDGATGDPAVDEAYKYSGDVWTFYKKVFGRNSIDDAGLKLISTVHAGRGYNNAFWNGVQMVYGDGDGVVFQRFTRSLDVVGHELTHGIVQYTSGLIYQGQSGALNEHFADVFGALVVQYRRKQTASKASWLIGADLLVPAPTRKAIRSMKAPGTAFVGDPYLGDDPQPAHMNNLYTGAGDNGGVHINSGIMNHAFYRAAISAKGYAWSTVGPIWYQVMQNLLPTSNFADCAAQLRQVSIAWAGGKHKKSVDKALKAVGL